MIRFFNPALTYQKHKEEFDAEIQRVLNAGDLILRDDVEKFEKTLAEYVGTKYCIGLNSCTDALYLALRYLKIGQGDEVLVPSRTFVATVQVIIQIGAIPVFYDLDNVLKITHKTKAIIPVHIEGSITEGFASILDMAEKNNIYIIEDAAQALGSEFKGGIIGEKDYKGKAGSFGIAGAFSFYPAKTLGAFGDAGALVTNDEKLYNWVKGARNHFKETAEDWGVNSRLDNLQAAILNVKFKHYEQALARRKEIAEKYIKELRGLYFWPHSEGPIDLILPNNQIGRVWQDFIIRTEKRDELFDYLKEQEIETMKNNYPFPIPKLPLAQKYEDETLRLPCNENITNEEVLEVIEKINQFFQKEEI